MDESLIAFDVLSDNGKPTEMFGDVLPESEAQALAVELTDLSTQAQAAISEVFNRQISLDNNGMRAVDSIVQGMWAEEWNPHTGNLRLFTTHFGSILAVAMLSVPGTHAIFRSSKRLDHFSVWLPSRNREYFPFHKAYKCLTAPVGESFSQMLADIQRR